MEQERLNSSGTASAVDPRDVKSDACKEMAQESPISIPIYEICDENSESAAKSHFQPAIECSVYPAAEGHWAIGSSMRCEILDESRIVEDALVTWKDSDGTRYCLRPQNPPVENKDFKVKMKPFFHIHWTSAIFEVGNDILIKVKYSPPNFYKFEGKAMNLVRSRTPSVPVPECIHFWIDREWNRTFLIMRRVHGVVLDDVWWSLSTMEKNQVADELAQHQVSIAKNITSPLFIGVDETANRHGFFNPIDPNIRRWDSDTRDIPGPLTPAQLEEQMRTLSGIEPRPIGPAFCLFHGDMNPDNVILSIGKRDDKGERDVRVAAIIDWESASYVPHWLITLWPGSKSLAYTLSLSTAQEDEDPYQMWDYVDRLEAKMKEHGWVSGQQNLAWWNNYEIELYKRKMRGFEEAKAAGLLKWLQSS